MTEIKPWQDRVKPGAFTGVKMEAMLAEIAEHRAAKVEQGEPVAWQYRMRPDWEDRWQGWVDCSKEAYRNMARVPLLHDWHYEVRALFTHPVRTMSDEPRYTVDQIADAACHAEVNDSKFESMCVYLGGIKGATA